MRIILIVLSCVALVGPAWAGKYALVLGNAEYETLSDLKNTHSDAEAYHETFQGLGYQVTFLKDLDFETTLEALDTFYAQLQPGDDVVLVFSGHGWSDGQVNYLIPTDAPRQARDSLLKRKTIALKNGYNGILDEFAQLGVGLTLAIIDACRNNPFEPPQGRKSVAMGRGLAPVQAQSGTLVIFSAGAGQEALDRLPDDPKDQRLSVFTRTFLPHLQSGLYVERAMAEAQKETADLARQAGGHMQTPAIYDEALGDTCLSGECVYQVTPAAQVRMPTTAAAPSQCDLLYNEARVSRECFQFEGYLDVCADHTFAPIARRFVSRQCTADTAAVQVTPRPQAQAVTPVAPQVAETVEKAPLEQTAQDQLTEYFARFGMTLAATESGAVIIDAVDRGSLAHHAGLGPGSQIMALAGQRVGTLTQVRDIFDALEMDGTAAHAIVEVRQKSSVLFAALRLPWGPDMPQPDPNTAVGEAELLLRKLTRSARPRKPAAIETEAPVPVDYKNACDTALLDRAHPKARELSLGSFDPAPVAVRAGMLSCALALHHDADFARGYLNMAHGHALLGNSAEQGGFLVKAALQQEPSASFQLYRMRKSAGAVEQALGYLIAAAKAGWPEAQFDLAQDLEAREGEGSPEAMEWYQSAARSDHPGAAKRLADLVEARLLQPETNFGSALKVTPQLAAQYRVQAVRLGDRSVFDRRQSDWSQDIARAVQVLLKDEGLYTGALDGLFEAGSLAALKKLVPPG